MLPTSRRAVRDLLDPADLSGARTVVEFGAGTGVCTREILKRLGPDARLLAFELDRSLARLVSEELGSDPRLRVINDSAENVTLYLEDEPADVIVSALPFTTLPAELRRSVLGAAHRALAPGGIFLVLQYSPLIRAELEALFGGVRFRFSPLNVPPAFLFACEKVPR
ncbi:class I SAM-dependent methyltransferase [Rubrobacter taiwanensis]|uniref:class I SAM-dependent methyltransferase n=1 Tax=Rubrobacter taiwanensis TaxID=185139 RepID=UPI001FB56997|nr:methyltransferase domain-containing protein [Rubrobacter taiwanensis]